MPEQTCRRRPTARPWLAAAVLAGAAAVVPAQQQPPADTFHVASRSFRLPFRQEATPPQPVRSYELYVANPAGAWELKATAPASERAFEFKGDRDGTFVCAVRTLYADGNASPQDVAKLQAGSRLVIDTAAPTVTLRSTPSNRAGIVQVEWDVRDDNLDLSSLRFEFRYPGPAETWKPLELRPEDRRAAGSSAWDFRTGERIDIRLSVSDLAKNPASKSLYGTDAPAAAANADTVIVNKRDINIPYNVSEVGPSGVAAVELWYTRDKTDWKKYDVSTSQRPDLNPDPTGVAVSKTPLPFHADADGRYGFSVIAKSGVGRGQRLPQRGDEPEIWVLIDTEKPAVQLTDVRLGVQPERPRDLTFVWKATDPNFGSEPITLEFAETQAGPWQPVAQNLPNTGRYVWPTVPERPYKFLVRIRAVDRANNEGSDVWQAEIVVDLNTPRAKITTISPAGQ